MNEMTEAQLSFRAIDLLTSNFEVFSAGTLWALLLYEEHSIDDLSTSKIYFSYQECWCFATQ
jgi:hypothetical protein